MLNDSSRSKIYVETQWFIINTLLHTIIFHYARDNDTFVARDFSLLLAPSCAENTRTDPKGSEETSDSSDNARDIWRYYNSWIGLIISKNLNLYHKICLNLMIYCLFFIFYKTINIKLFEIIYLFIEKVVISSKMNILKFKKDNCIN